MSAAHEDSLPFELIERAKVTFHKFDTNHNGAIDIRELRAIMKSMRVMLNDEELSQIMKEVDTDGSGEIDWEEFLEVSAPSPTH